MFPSDLVSQLSAMEENGSVQSWIVFGKHIPKLEVVCMSQIIILYIVIITSVVNLSIQNGDPTLWSTLLGSCLGYTLPNPSIKRSKLIPPQPPSSI